MYTNKSELLKHRKQIHAKHIPLTTTLRKEHVFSVMKIAGLTMMIISKKMKVKMKIKM
jgi:hypothetical protein